MTTFEENGWNNLWANVCKKSSDVMVAHYGPFVEGKGSRCLGVLRLPTQDLKTVEGLKHYLAPEFKNPRSEYVEVIGDHTGGMYMFRKLSTGADPNDFQNLVQLESYTTVAQSVEELDNGAQGVGIRVAYGDHNRIAPSEYLNNYVPVASLLAGAHKVLFNSPRSTANKRDLEEDGVVNLRRAADQYSCVINPLSNAGAEDAAWNFDANYRVDLQEISQVASFYDSNYFRYYAAANDFGMFTLGVMISPRNPTYLYVFGFANPIQGSGLQPLQLPVLKCRLKPGN